MSDDAPRELRAAVLAMRAADKDIRRDVSGQLRSEMNPVWRDAVSRRITRPQDSIVLASGVRIAGGNPPAFIAGNGSRSKGSGGGLQPVRDWPGWEYGAGRKTATYTARRGGTSYRITRNVTAGYPRRSRHGRVLGPAARAVLPRAASYWVQSVIRAWLDAAETGR